MSARHLVVVPHTHWDREWYRTHEEFRYRLVRLVDGLLDLLEGNPAFRHFTLDGQAIVVDDYLEVRPGARERIAKLVRDGRLLVGPWYVLPDEWLVSGEALIRNLELGLRRAEALGAAMRLGYVPDQFGHVGQLPQIFAGFGFEAAVLWRGVGADVASTPFTWEAPDGTRLLTVYLPHGYGNAAQLPAEADALAGRLRQAIAALEPFATTPTLLLMNGSDHLRPEPGLPAALEAALAKLDGVTGEIGTLPGFVARVRAEAPADLPVHRGELRSGLRAPLLPGCASARAPQKRSDFDNDALLTRVLEPLSAWLAALGGDADPEVIGLAWRVALENHPHDSICGCSVDAVHDQMDTRFRRVREIATTHLARVAGELLQRVAVPAAGFGRGAGESLVVWNPGASGRALVEAEVELDVPLRGRRVGRLHLRDARGGRIPAAAEVAEPGRELFRMRIRKAFAGLLLGAFGEEFAGQPVRDARWEIRDGTLDLRVRVSELAAGFDVAGARRRLEADLSRDDVEHFAVRVVLPPRIRLRFADALPGCGLRVYRVARGRALPAGATRVAAGRNASGAAGAARSELQASEGRAAGRSPAQARDASGAAGAARSELQASEGRAAGRSPAQARAAGGAWLENEHWRVEVDGAARVRLTRKADGLVVEDALRVVSEGDRGDEYNFDPVPGDAPVERPARVRVSLEQPGEARVALAIDARYALPAGLAPGRGRRSARRVALSVRLRIALHEGLDRIDLALACQNAARDQRLRLHVRAPFEAQRFEVESAFEVAERPIAPQPGDFGSDRPAELPIGAVPQRSFATLAGGALALTVANRGAAEVEAVPEADGTTSLAVTVLRAVGWLSRDDLHVRPGHAGPPLETPGAQVPGHHRLELSLRLHPAGEAERVARAHAFAFPPRAFAGGGPPAAPLRDGARLFEVDDPAVVVSAIQPGPDGRARVRLWNASAEARRVRVAWSGPGARALEPVDLAGRPDPRAGLEPEGAGGWLRLRPWQITTLRVV